jgi:SLOG in TRPM, prokaryote
MENYFKLTFNPEQAAIAITVSEIAKLPNALAKIGLGGSHPILVLVGGASQISDADFLRIQSLFVEVLAPIAESVGAYVVDGGTDAGVMRLMGHARSYIKAQFPLIGVAPIGKVIFPEQTTTPSDDASPLQSDHTHFVLVPGNNWGDESPWIVDVGTVLAGCSPSVTLLINGGEITFADALNSVSAGRLVIAIAGSGRTADKLALALGGNTTDERATKLAASGKLQTINLDAEREELTKTITNLLSN